MDREINIRTKKRVYIVSFNFNPGHVSHMKASYKQLEEIGYDPCLYVVCSFVPFLPEGYRYLIYGEQKPGACDWVIFLFPSLYNLKEIAKFKIKHKSKIAYVFHEPLENYSSFRKAGFTHRQMLKLRIIDLVNMITVRMCDLILLPSEKALRYYDASKGYKNANRHYLPLMYDDENTMEKETTKREFFSYIGTIASDHSFNEFLSFARESISSNILPGVKFLIATRSHLDKNDHLRTLTESGRLTIVEGAPLTDEEINTYYQSSIAVWNAYERTTQSGVLAKAFMFGTPAIVLKKNLSEFTKDGDDVVAINDNRSTAEIQQAIELILSDSKNFSNACRRRFLTTFFYRNYNQFMRDVLSKY